VHEPIEIHCAACGKPVTLWAPDPTLGFAFRVPPELDGWACPWCKARRQEGSVGVLWYAMAGHRAAEIRQLLEFAHADSGTFPMECNHCNGAVMIRLVDMKPDSEPMRPATWVCPYCEKENGGEFAGRIEWLRKGSEEPTLG
jgi:DNA-directed RNA polymerase subunit RPC12/RpoP